MLFLVYLCLIAYYIDLELDSHHLLVEVEELHDLCDKPPLWDDDFIQSLTFINKADSVFL